jgi:hypothetical protein
MVPDTMVFVAFFRKDYMVDKSNQRDVTAIVSVLAALVWLIIGIMLFFFILPTAATVWMEIGQPIPWMVTIPTRLLVIAICTTFAWLCFCRRRWAFYFRYATIGLALLLLFYRSIFNQPRLGPSTSSLIGNSR